MFSVPNFKRAYASAYPYPPRPVGCGAVYE